MHKVEFKSIKEVDLTKLSVPQVAVHYRPEDYPKKAVGRVMDNGKETNIVILADDPVELRRDICQNTSLKFYWRGKDDAETLIGVFW